MVERYEFTCHDSDPDAVNVNHGRYVRYADYAELEAKVERLTKERNYWKVEAEGERAKVEYRDRKAEALSRTGAVKVSELLDEGLEILNGIIDNVKRRGNYSPESTCVFIDQAGQCLREALSALEPAADHIAAAGKMVEPAAPKGQQEPVALTYGQKLIAEAIEHHFGERGENYDEYEGDTTVDDVWDAFDALTRPSEQAVTGEMVEAAAIAISGGRKDLWDGFDLFKRASFRTRAMHALKAAMGAGHD